MKAIQLGRFGGPEVLEVIDTAMPEPAPGELRVRVHAAGMNYFEVLMRQDKYAMTPQLPMVLGVEVAGVVDAVGSGVSMAVGSRVAVPLFMSGRAGGYAQYVCAPEGCVVPLPDDVSYDTAVALMVQGLTALHAVRRCPPRGKSLLVNAAAGGLGLLLLQLARREGASLIVAAAGSAQKLARAASLGADAGVQYTDPDWTGRVKHATEGRGVDLVYDFVGGDLGRASLDALAPQGEILMGALGRIAIDRADLEVASQRNQSVKGLALLPLLSPQTLQSDLGELFALAASGTLRVLIGAKFPLEHAADAHQAFDLRSTEGKVVLSPL